MKKNFKFFIFLSLFLSLASIFGYYLVFEKKLWVDAASGDNVSGFAWNEHVGWIGLNSIDLDENFQLVDNLEISDETLPEDGKNIDSVITTDFNDDGHDDMALAYTFYENVFVFEYNRRSFVSVYLNDGNGNLLKDNDYFLTNATNVDDPEIMIAYFDSDPYPDIVVPHIGYSVFSVLLNNNGGVGNFYPAVNYNANGEIISLDVDDMNNDDVLDIIVATEYDDNGNDVFGATVYTNDGSGVFTQETPVRIVTSSATYSYFEPIVIEDFNNDSYPDLAAVFKLQSFYFYDYFRLFENVNGTLQFASTSDPGEDPANLHSADFNGDGYKDLVMTNRDDNGVSVLLNDQNGSFPIDNNISLGVTPGLITIKDIDGDSDEDIAVTISDRSSVYFLLNNGSGSFSSQRVLDMNDGDYVYIESDFNNDGYVDVVEGENSGDLRFYLNDQNGVFSEEYIYASLHSDDIKEIPGLMSSLDINNDGIFDFAMVNEATDRETISVYVNNINFANIDFGININETTGNFSGHAWNNQVGWISFATSTTPDDSVVTDNCDASCDPSAGCSACYVNSTQRVYGWAQILSLGENGWIRLDDDDTGDAFDYGLTYNDGTEEFEGFAYNTGDEGVGIGWISFNCLSDSSCGNSDYQVKTQGVVFPKQDPVVTFSAMADPGYCSSDPFCTGRCACGSDSCVLEPELRWHYSDGDGDSYESYQLVFDSSFHDISTLDDLTDGSGNALPLKTDRIYDTDTNFFPADPLNPHREVNISPNTSYYYWVKVWSDDGASSSWMQFNDPSDADNDSNDYTFTTYANEFPDPFFIWSPKKPNKGAYTKFIDQSTVYDVNSEPDTIRWEFSNEQDFTDSFDNASSTLQVFNDNEFFATSTVTDANGYSCATTSNIESFSRRIPTWIEGR